MEGVAKANLLDVKALIFGTAKSANQKYCDAQFEKDFKLQCCAEYLGVLIDGINQFCRKPKKRKVQRAQTVNAQKHKRLFGRIHEHCNIKTENVS